MVFPFFAPEAPHARAALRVEVARAAPGKAFLAAVEVATDPHWHVYWRNPGDSGVPTRIEWRAPKGWKVEPLEFPVPKRFAPGGITAYGYEGRTLFLARVTPSKAPGALSAKASWLVCKEACVQGGASLAAKVALGRKAVPGRMAAPLRAAQARLPLASPGWSVRAVAGKGVLLTVVPRPTFPGRPDWGHAEFFPAESGAVDQGKPLLATLQGGTLVFKMDASPFPEGRTRLPGLVVTTVGGQRRATLVNPVLEKGK